MMMLGLRFRSFLRCILIITTTAAAAALVTSAVAWTPLPVADDPLVRMPGSQPGSAVLVWPDQCLNCHADFDPVTAPAIWRGSMMAQAARDPLMWAAVTVAAQDSIWALGNPNATDLCLRCHFPQGWLDGRSDPTNGSLMTGVDFDGVHCGLCHHLVDPFFETTYAGTREGSDWSGYWDETDLSATTSSIAADATYLLDQDIAATIEMFNGDPFYGADNLPPLTYTESAGGQYLADPVDRRRASFADANPSHNFTYSRFHKSRYLCATCHDVSNPVFVNAEHEGAGPLPSETESAFSYGHVERTFSEFMLSDFGQQGGAPGTGAFAPEVFETSVSDNSIARCQDCHMPDAVGRAASQNKAVLRPTESVEHSHSGVPSHDLTGGNAWIPQVLASSVPGSSNYDSTNDTLLNQGSAALTLDLSEGLGLDPASLLAGADKALVNLERAATLEDALYDHATGDLSFRVRNHTGHKLISGFPEGRRMWLNIRALDGSGAVLWEINPYDADASTLKGLSHPYSDPDDILPDPQPLTATERHLDELVYEMVPSSTLTGEAHSFHFVLADGRFKDNRIPPRGFRISEAADRLAEPAWNGSADPGYFTTDEYAGGYDEVAVSLPSGAAQIEITLYYQTTSREYIEFLRDEINGTGHLTLTSPTPSGETDAYVVQTDPFFDQLAAWGATIWQLWRHNRTLAGAAPVVMTQTTVVADATLVVEKQTVPDGDPQSFTFSGTASGSIADGEQLVVSGLSPGTYTVTESVPSGWQLSSIACDDTDSSDDLPSATASYVLGAGETVTCVFTNVADGACAEEHLHDDTVNWTETFTGCPSVTLGPNWTVQDPGDVTVLASEWIEIQNGFAVTSGATFTAGIDLSLAP